MAKSIFILNGPNLNFLGVREPEVYGDKTLEDIEGICKEKCKALGLDLMFKQHNSEGDMVTTIQKARGAVSGIIINAAAFTHTSVAIRDSLIMSDVPIVEVHLSNVYKREEFRHKSYISDIAEVVICGLGVVGYEAAIDFLARKL